MPIAKTLIYLLVGAAILLGYAKYIELHGLYYPTREIEATPASLKLPFEEIFLTSEDKLRIHGWFVPAVNARYTLLFCHGNGGNISHRLDKILLFNQLGLNVFIIDYRGYGKSEGRPSEQGFYRDARAAYSYLMRRGFAPGELILYGESLGTAVVIELAQQRQARALVIEGAFSRGKDMAKVVYPFLPAILVNSYDSLARISNIAIPKLFFHSKGDEVVPFRLAEKLFQAAPEPKYFSELTGGHNDAVFLNEVIFVSSMESFIEKL
ncbi:MAG: alpha/beta hydrolase [Candidatus Omnitrophota bacterium]